MDSAVFSFCLFIIMFCFEFVDTFLGICGNRKLLFGCRIGTSKKSH